jgi:zinc protease
VAATVAAALVVLAPQAAGGKERNLRPAIQMNQLDNGLTVYTLEDRGAPLVTYEVWFRVGSGHEREGTGGEHGNTGLSHFFEHMMFRGTAAHPKYFEEVYELGGQLNAWTWVDSTVYWEKVPSQHLRTIIGLEADRLRNMDMSFLALEPEREVVKSERLLRTENDPGGAMSELLFAAAFREHPYHWPTVGWMSDLNAITLEEASAYHKAHYVPNNAFVVVVGDFDTQEVLGWIEEEYGSLPSAELPHHDPPEEAPQTAERRDYLFKEVEADQFTTGYRVPALRDPDRAVLDLINEILNGGKSSRLKARLVYGDVPIVSRLGSSLYPMRDPALYVWTVQMLPGHANAEALTAISEEMERLASEPVTGPELTKAVNRLRADTIRGMLTHQQRADIIGFGVLTTGNPYVFFDMIEEYAKVTPEDIQRVAKKWLSDSNRTTITAVGPTRFQKAWAAVGEAAGSEGRAELTNRAVALWLDAVDLAGRAHEIERETGAIAKLADRAKLARDKAAGDADEIAAIDEYTDKSDKGTVARTKALEALRAAYAEGTEAHAKAAGELVADLDSATGELRPAEVALADLFARGDESGMSGPLPRETDADRLMEAGARLLYAGWLDWKQREAEGDAQRALASEALAAVKSTDESMARAVETLRLLRQDTQRLHVLPRSQTVGI